MSGETAGVGLQIGGAQEAAKPSAPDKAVVRRIAKATVEQDKRIATGKDGIQQITKVSKTIFDETKQEVPENATPVQKAAAREKRISDAIAKLPNWQNDKKTRAFVGEAIDLHDELEAAKQDIRKNLPEGITEISDVQLEKQVNKIVRDKRIAAATKALEPGKASEPEKKLTEPDNKTETTQTETPETEEDTKLRQEAEKKGIEAAKAAAAAEEKARADKAAKDKIKQDVDEWIAQGERPELTRFFLEKVAKEQAEEVAKANVKELSEQLADVKSEKERDSITSQLRRAKEVLKVAEDARVELQNRMKNVRDKDSTDSETRLLIFDLDLAQNDQAISIAQYKVNRIMGQLAAASDDYEKVAMSEELKKAEENLTSQKNAKDELKAKRDEVPGEKKDVNRVVALVTQLTVPEGEEAAAKTAREAAIQANPLRYLDSLAADSKALENILDHSGLDAKQKDLLRKTAKAQTATQAVQGKEDRDNIKSTGVFGLLSILLLCYTASAQNKAKKGQQA